MSSFFVETKVYLEHVGSVLLPGVRVRDHAVVPTEVAAVGDLKDWSDDEHRLLIEEGRLTLDRQQVRFDRLRTTAQVVLPLSVALLVVFGVELEHLAGSYDLQFFAYAVWSVGSSLVLLAALGAGATLSVRSDFGTILPSLVSQLAHDEVLTELAKAYAEQATTGETTLGTRVTVIRDAVTLLALGGTLHLILWLTH